MSRKQAILPVVSKISVIWPAPTKDARLRQNYYVGKKYFLPDVMRGFTAFVTKAARNAKAFPGKCRAVFNDERWSVDRINRALHEHCDS